MPGGEDAGLDVYAQMLGAAIAVALEHSATLLRPDVGRWLVASANPLWKQQLVEALALLVSEDGQLAWRPNEATEQALRRLRQRFQVRASTADGADSTSSGLTAALGAAEADAGSAPASPLEFLESFFGVVDSGRRKRRGIFYTPRPIARFIVRQVDRQLRDEFGLADGLADTTSWSTVAARQPDIVLPCGQSPDGPLVTILDPALGSGVFFEQVIDVIYARLRPRQQPESADTTEHYGPHAAHGTLVMDGKAWTDKPGADPAWNAYVQQLLPRLVGLEIMPQACLVAYLKLAAKLAQTGYAFDQPAIPEIHLINTIGGPRSLEVPAEASPYESAIQAARHAAFFRPMTVIIGNPPFSGISQTDGRWIDGLLHGRDPDCPRAASYYRVNGSELGERKVWLQDDYVKFLRYAHWQIERAGLGLIGWISNHGYLDNPTFRGVRYQLLRTFPQIEVIDLHGNRKKKESAPDGGADQNVFRIEQGTAIGLFRRPPGSTSASDAAPPEQQAPANSAPPAQASAGRFAETAEVVHRELWGRADQKLAALEACAFPGQAAAIPGPLRLTPCKPQYLFAPRDESLSDEYRCGYRLPEILPVNVTAPVTARDGFVIALDREELCERMRLFRDLAVHDDRIRERFFARTRSTRHRTGDTRGWKLNVARQRMAQDPVWADRIRTCWYRPFDRRYIFWSGEMIDWPRQQIMSHLLAAPNRALIARRQMLPSQPCTYFWIADDLALDGIIRSDNRGSESIFPLYLYDQAAGQAARRSNLDGSFVSALGAAVGMDWSEEPAGDRWPCFGPSDVLDFCYALFHSPTYRQRYADQLRSDFPRVFLPATGALFADLVRCGRRLSDAHLLRSTAREPVRPRCFPVGDADWTIAAGHPRYDGQRVLLNPRCGFASVSAEVWEFQAGGHQVCRKWLKDRRGRRLSATERGVYQQILGAIALTQHTMKRIDDAIQRHGGWPDAFRVDPRRGTVPK